jgi:hypothetical protein
MKGSYMTNGTLTLPSADGVKKACDNSNPDMTDLALFKLFKQYPENTDLSEVLLKVVTLNFLYSTRIRVKSLYSPTVYDVAQHIVDRKIDESLRLGDEGLVEKITNIGVADKIHYYYVFATKYCSFHRPESYPIFDSRVKEYLWQLRNKGGLRRFQQQVLWNYAEFKKIINELRDQYGLRDCPYKQIDAFLFLEGKKLIAAKEKNKAGTPAE